MSADTLTPRIDEDSLFSEGARRVLLDLSNGRRATVRAFFGAVAAKQDAMGEDFLNAVAKARAVGKEPMFRRMLDWMLICAPKVESLPDAQASTAIRQWAQRIELFLGPMETPNILCFRR